MSSYCMGHGPFRGFRCMQCVREGRLQDNDRVMVTEEHTVYEGEGGKPVVFPKGARGVVVDTDDMDIEVQIDGIGRWWTSRNLLKPIERVPHK